MNELDEHRLDVLKRLSKNVEEKRNKHMLELCDLAKQTNAIFKEIEKIWARSRKSK